MSGFKYLSEAQSSNAATEFLQKQLGKNKYTSGDPYAYGEGATPGGEGYRDQLRVTNQDEIDQWHKDNPDGGKASNEGGYVDGYKPFKADRSWEGAGKIEDLFDAEELEELRAHAKGAKGSNAFGYTSDTEHHFKETEDPTSGDSIEAKMRKVGKHLGYEHWGTHNPERVRDFIMRAEETKAKDGPPEPEFKMDPIEHSPQIKQAKERVKAFEEGAWSGQTSQEIYGSGGQDAQNKYVFDSSKGAAGIGTSASSASQQSAATATQSFLDNKKTQVKKTLTPVN